jgi:hypothetical protein
MRNVIALLVLFGLGWYGYSQYQRRVELTGTPDFLPPLTKPSPAPSTGASGTVYKCDGRIYCSQMTSCAEATYFLQNCPGTKMDGNNDGIPCEKQWCK